MPAKRWNERFLTSTRGRIVVLLRGDLRTVNELADALELTDNAVRAHLAALERDGLVEQHGVRRGIGKPAHVFRLTAEAESLFPKAYAFLAGELVRELANRGDTTLEESLRDVGRRAGRRAGVGGADAAERLGGTLALLESLGGEATVLPDGSQTVVQGHACPLSDVVAAEPRTCHFLEGLVEGAVGAAVTQFCEHGPQPRCRFRIETTKSAG